MDILMPKVGLTMTEGTITQWHKRAGDRVRKGEVLFTFETEKSTLEFESPFEGVLQMILVPAGQVTECLAPVAQMNAPEEAIADTVATAQPKQAERKQVASIEANATSASVTGRAISPRARLRAHEMNVNLGNVTGSGPGGTVLERDVLSASRKQPIPTQVPRLTPLAQRVATELGVNPATVEGSGPGGRVTREDVARAAQVKGEVTSAVPSGETELQQLLQPLTPARRVTAQRTAESARNAPHVTLTTEVDATALVSAREQLTAELDGQRTGDKMSYNALLVAIVARALREHSALNASWAESAIRVHREVHIGVAVDTPHGLYVPVVRDAVRPLIQIHRDLTDLVARAQAGTLTTDDMAGGTFTITNLGMFEIDAFTPIINQPQAAILGVGRIIGKPVARGEQVVVRQMMTLSLSFDHRVVDGAPAAKFLQRVKALIERPFALLV